MEGVKEISNPLMGGERNQQPWYGGVKEISNPQVGGERNQQPSNVGWKKSATL